MTDYNHDNTPANREALLREAAQLALRYDPDNEEYPRAAFPDENVARVIRSLRHELLVANTPVPPQAQAQHRDAAELERDRDTIEILVGGAADRLDTLCNVKDARCGCDALAREEVQLYIGSWVSKRLRNALKLIRGDPIDRETRHIIALEVADEHQPLVQEAPVRGHFSPLSKLSYPAGRDEKALTERDAARADNERLRSLVSRLSAELRNAHGREADDDEYCPNEAPLLREADAALAAAAAPTTSTPETMCLRAAGEKLRDAVRPVIAWHLTTCDPEHAAAVERAWDEFSAVLAAPVTLAPAEWTRELRECDAVIATYAPNGLERVKRIRSWIAQAIATGPAAATPASDADRALVARFAKIADGGWYTQPPLSVPETKRLLALASLAVAAAPDEVSCVPPTFPLVDVPPIFDPDAPDIDNGAATQDE